MPIYYKNAIAGPRIEFQEAELSDHGVILEYQLPLSSRRLDCIVTRTATCSIRPSRKLAPRSAAGYAIVPPYLVAVDCDPNRSIRGIS